MILSTTNTIENRPAQQYLGIVTGEAILGANIFRDFLAGIRDVVGGRSAAYEASLREAQQIAMREMEQKAQSLGANAIVGIDLDYENINMSSGGSGGMLMVTASGTAVKIAE